MKSESKDLIIKALREENLELKLKLLDKTKQLPTDDSTRKSYFNQFIHKAKEPVKSSCKVG